MTVQREPRASGLLDGRERSTPEVRPRTPPFGPIAGMVMGLQRSAGNLAVARALAGSRRGDRRTGPVALQRASEGRDAKSSAGPQLAAIWNTQVVVPIARAADRVGRAEADLKGARADLDGAVRTITTLRDATPADDPNRAKFEIVWRRARGVLDLVDHRLGKGKDDNRLESDMTKARLEAVDLGPKLQHWPAVTSDEADAAVAATAPGGPDTNQAAGKAAPEPDPREKARNAGLVTQLEGNTIQDRWKESVVDRLWQAQRQLSEKPYLAIFDYSSARLDVVKFLAGTPEGHPNRMRLLQLDAALEANAGLLRERAPDFASDTLPDQATSAWETVVEMLEYLPGGKASAATQAPPAGGTAGAPQKPGGKDQPEFTWERERPPMKNDTNLERP